MKLKAIRSFTVDVFGFPGCQSNLPKPPGRGRRRGGRGLALGRAASRCRQGPVIIGADPLLPHRPLPRHCPRRLTRYGAGAAFYLERSASLPTTLLPHPLRVARWGGGHTNPLLLAPCFVGLLGRLRNSCWGAAKGRESPPAVGNVLGALMGSLAVGECFSGEVFPPPFFLRSSVVGESFGERTGGPSLPPLSIRRLHELGMR